MHCGLACTVNYQTWHFDIAFVEITMVAAQEVGKISAALLMVLVMEAQCWINVNLLLDTPNS